jgi:RNA polymerase sigma-70 factor (ECF subfamily)
LYGLAVALTRNKCDAEDLLQTTYLRAWRFFDQFQTGSSFQKWVTTILYNNFINAQRQKKRRSRFFDSSFDVERQANAVERYYSAPPEDALSTRNDMADPVIVALRKLPEHYRVVVLLCDVSDFKYKEVAEMLECPIGTVMSRLHRARSILAQSLRTYAVREGYVKRESVYA